MKAVIFDMDGVIVDSEPLHEKHIEMLLVNIGVADPKQFKGNLKGVNATDTWRILIEEFDLKYDVEELATKSKDSYLEHLKALPELPAIPGAVNFIKYLSTQKYRLALASSAAPKRIELFLKKLRIDKYFEVVVAGDHVEHSKPAPDIFLLAAKKLGVKPVDCVVIEDAWNGVQAAKAAGMKCIAYAGSEHNTDDLSAADVVIKDFAALTRSLQGEGLPV